MPRFMGGMSNKNAWSRTGGVPKCAPNKTTLMEAAAEMRAINAKSARKNASDLRQAEAQLAKAQSKGDAKAAKRAAQQVKKIKGRK